VTSRTAVRRTGSAPRRKYRSYYASPAICFGSAFGLPLYGWAALGHPFSIPGVQAAWSQAAGLFVMVMAGLAVIPVVFVTLVCFAPDLPKLAVPRSWRASYRNRQDRYGYKKRSRADQKSSYISTRLRRLINAADRFRCVACGMPGTDVDHRIPWSWGGLTILWNCFTLCPTCNRVIKVDYWEDWHGHPHWGRHFNRENQAAAHYIFRRESGLHGRWNLLRLFRIAWAVGSG
jgi:5-methylcytosine-specific restriction endonuclease McrA